MQSSEDSTRSPMSAHLQKYIPYHTSVIWVSDLLHVETSHFKDRNLCDRDTFPILCVQQLFLPCLSLCLAVEVSRQRWEERGQDIYMTLELVELKGQNLLSGTALAAAGFFPCGCWRLMPALGVWRWQWGVGGGVFWCMYSYAVGAWVAQEMSTH